MNIKYLFFILVLSLITVSVNGSLSDNFIEHKQSFAVMKINDTIQDHTGLRYSVLNNGYYKITDLNNDERFFGFAITGVYNSNPITKTVEDYTWTYNISEQNYSNSSILEYYNVTAINDDNSWKINFLFYTDNRDMKILHTLTNVYPQSITNTKMWYIMTLKNSDSIKYNGIDYSNQTVFLNNNLTQILPKIKFNTDFNFKYDDLIENNFTISNFYLGNGSIIGYSNYNIMALGVTKNSGVFPSGTTIILDPTIGDETFNTDTAAFFDNTEVSGGMIILSNTSLNGTFTRVLDIWNQSTSFNLSDTYYVHNLSICNWEAQNTMWVSNASVVTGLSDVGDMSNPEAFRKDGTLYLIAGEATGVFNGYNWTGSTWQSDTGIISGLGDVGDRSTPAVFEKDGTWYLISGTQNSFSGFNWTGSAWQADTGIISGLGVPGTNLYPTVFEIDSTWYAIVGEWDGIFNGYNWTGSAWQSDAGIVNGLVDVGSKSTPDVFYKNGTWYLITGDSAGTFTGYNWDGSSWQANSNIDSGLGGVGGFSSQTTFYDNSAWKLIAGETDGVFNGYSFLEPGVGTLNVTVDVSYSNVTREVYNETGLVGFWDFTENGTTAFDQSPENNDATQSGNPVFKNNSDCYPFGDGCWDLDGNDRWVVTGTTGMDFGTGDYTFEFWVNFDDWDAGLAKTSLAGGVATGLQIAYNHPNWANSLYIHSSAQGSCIASTTTTFNNDDWFHIVMTERSNILYFYVDGVQVGTGTSCSNSFGTETSFTIANLVTSYYLDGSFDSFRVYNRGMELNEVKWNYFHSHPDNFTEPITYSCEDDVALPGTDAARYIMYNASLTTTDTDWTPVFNSIYFDYNNVIGISSSITVNIISVTALNSSGGTIANFSTEFLEEIETVRVNATITSVGGELSINGLYLNFTAGGQNGCAVGNLQDEICYNYNNDTYKWIQFINGTNTSTFNALNVAAGDIILESISLSADNLSANISFLIEEHYNPNIIKHYSALYNFSDLKWQDNPGQQIHQNDMIQIHMEEKNLPLDADQYKLDIRVNYTQGANIPTEPLNAYLCNENHTSGSPQLSTDCALVGSKFPNELQDDGTKFRAIFTQELISEIGNINHLTLRTPENNPNKYYFIKTYKATAANYTTHWNYSTNGGVTWNNLGDGYESEANINFFYDGAEPTALVLRLWANNSVGITSFDEFNNTWSIDPTQNYPPIVDILTPDVNDTLIPRDGEFINWTIVDTNVNDTHNVSIFLYQNGGIVRTIATGMNKSNSSLLWVDATIIDGAYELVIIVSENNTVDNFTRNDTHEININGLPNITLITPNNASFLDSTNNSLNASIIDNNGLLWAYLYVWNSTGDVQNKVEQIDLADASAILVSDGGDIGDWRNTTILDGNSMIVQERSASPGFTFYLNFTDMQENTENMIISMYAQYDGAAADDVFAYLFNFTSGDYVQFIQISNDNALEWHNFTVNTSTSDFISSTGITQLMINHTDPGSPAHKFLTDYVQIRTQSWSDRINLSGESNVNVSSYQNLSSDVYTWNYKAYDNIYQSNWADNNFTFTIDVEGPVINITSPTEGQIFNTTYTYNIDLNYTVYDILNGVEDCWYSLNGGINISTNCINVSITVPEGNNYIYVYANDSAGNIGVSTQRNFTLNIEGVWDIDLIDVPITGTTSVEFIVNSTATIIDSTGINSNVTWTHDAGGLCIAQTIENYTYGDLGIGSQKSFGVGYICSAAGNYEITVEWCTAHGCMNASQTINVAASTTDEILFCLRDGLCDGWWIEKIPNWQEIQESQRGHHTTELARILFVDAVNGIDTNDGTSSARPVKTIQKAVDVAPDNGHTTIRVMSSLVGQTTVYTECVSVDKNYVFIRGDGRDVLIEPDGACSPFTITSEGVEIHGLRIDMNYSTKTAIDVQGDFAWLHNLWIENSNGIAIHLQSSHNIVEDTYINYFFDNTTSGIHIDGTTLTARQNTIQNNRFNHVLGDAILIEGVNAAHNHIDSNRFIDSNIGIHIKDNAFESLITDNRYSTITTEFLDETSLPSNAYINNEQYATNEIVLSINQSLSADIALVEFLITSGYISEDVWNYTDGKYINGETP